MWITCLSDQNPPARGMTRPDKDKSSAVEEGMPGSASVVRAGRAGGELGEGTTFEEGPLRQ